MLLALFWLLFTCYPFQAQWSLYQRGVLEPPPRRAGHDPLSAPIIILWTIQMNRAKKIRLFVVWAIGGITVLGGLLRQVRPLVHRDMTWDYVEVLAWTSLDLALGIVTASLPILDGMLWNAWQRAMSSIGGSSQETTNNNSAPSTRTPNVEQSGMPSRVYGPSESEEHIVSKDDSMKMDIVRTRVVRVQSSSRSSLDAFDFGCPALTETVHQSTASRT